MERTTREYLDVLTRIQRCDVGESFKEKNFSITSNFSFKLKINKISLSQSETVGPTSCHRISIE